jgi:hypothetical protein
MQARDARENRQRGYDVGGLINAVKSGNYEAPVLLKLPTGVYVIGGRTRLYAALALGIPAKVKIISGSTFAKQAVAEDINAEFLAKLANALNGTPGQAAPSTGTKDREDIENVSRGDDEERKEVVNVQRKKSKTTSIAKQASIKHGLDESFKIATAAGYSQFLTAADCGIKMQGGFAFHPSVLPPEDEEEADDDHV